MFRRKEQTWKRLRVGLRTDDNIPKNVSSIRDIVETILWMLLLLQLFARTLSVQRLGMVQIKHYFVVYVWLAQLHMTILFPLLDAVKLVSLRAVKAMQQYHERVAIDLRGI